MNPVKRLSDHGLAIFLFHGVIEEVDYAVRNYTRKHLGRDYFYQSMQDLKRKGYPLSMDEVVEHYNAAESFPLGAFAVTFDDGFENNYSVAAPILVDMKIPATFYVTTSFIEHNSMSWTDRIEYCLEVIPEGRLVFPWDQSTHFFRTTEGKIRLLDYLRSHVKRDTSINLDVLVSDIFSQCGVQEIRQSDDSLDLKMNWKQVSELNRDGNFLVGGHTHRHVVLSFLSETELEAEIKTSTTLLEQEAGVRSRHYSYPEGLEYCYSDEVIEALKRHGIVCCPTAEDGTNRIGDSLFHLKRIVVT